MAVNPENSVNSAQICNFSQMGQDEYIRRAMFRADLREQLRYAKDKSRDETSDEIFALWESGMSLTEAKKKFESNRHLQNKTNNDGSF